MISLLLLWHRQWFETGDGQGYGGPPIRRGDYERFHKRISERLRRIKEVTKKKELAEKIEEAEKELEKAEAFKAEDSQDETPIIPLDAFPAIFQKLFIIEMLLISMEQRFQKEQLDLLDEYLLCLLL